MLPSSTLFTVDSLPLKLTQTILWVSMPQYKWQVLIMWRSPARFIIYVKVVVPPSTVQASGRTWPAFAWYRSSRWCPFCVALPWSSSESFLYFFNSISETKLVECEPVYFLCSKPVPSFVNYFDRHLKLALKCTTCLRGKSEKATIANKWVQKMRLF